MTDISPLAGNVSSFPISQGNDNTFPSKPPRAPRAFSLIELLSVIAVMLTIAALSLPSISNTLSGMKITSATQTVADEIQVARATALARNTPVEVWFLQKNGRFTAVRSLILNADNTTTWASRPRALPDGIVLATHENFSNIIGSQTLGTPPDSPAGTLGVCLRIFPSGKLELGNAQALGSNEPHFLTLASLAGFDPDSTTLPPNFATIQINPVNSRITTHRP